MSGYTDSLREIKAETKKTVEATADDIRVMSTTINRLADELIECRNELCFRCKGYLANPAMSACNGCKWR